MMVLYSRVNPYIVLGFTPSRFKKLFYCVWFTITFYGSLSVRVILYPWKSQMMKNAILVLFSSLVFMTHNLHKSKIGRYAFGNKNLFFTSLNINPRIKDEFSVLRNFTDTIFRLYIYIHENRWQLQMMRMSHPSRLVFTVLLSNSLTACTFLKCRISPIHHHKKYRNKKYPCLACL